MVAVLGVAFDRQQRQFLVTFGHCGPQCQQMVRLFSGYNHTMFPYQTIQQQDSEIFTVLLRVAPQLGLEPRTSGLTVRCSTN